MSERMTGLFMIAALLGVALVIAALLVYAVMSGYQLPAGW